MRVRALLPPGAGCVTRLRRAARHDHVQRCAVSTLTGAARSVRPPAGPAPSPGLRRQRVNPPSLRPTSSRTVALRKHHRRLIVVGATTPTARRPPPRRVTRPRATLVTIADPCECHDAHCAPASSAAREAAARKLARRPWRRRAISRRRTTLAEHERARRRARRLGEAGGAQAAAAEHRTVGASRRPRRAFSFPFERESQGVCVAGCSDGWVVLGGVGRRCALARPRRAFSMEERGGLREGRADSREGGWDVGTNQFRFEP
jgi:hypothetical protein